MIQAINAYSAYIYTHSTAETSVHIDQDLYQLLLMVANQNALKQALKKKWILQNNYKQGDEITKKIATGQWLWRTMRRFFIKIPAQRRKLGRYLKDQSQNSFQTQKKPNLTMLRKK